MLYSCFSCYQYVASCYVLRNLDLNPGWNATRNFVNNLRIETDIWVRALLVTKLCWPILRELVEIFGVNFANKQQLRILNVDKMDSKWL